MLQKMEYEDTSTASKDAKNTTTLHISPDTTDFVSVTTTTAHHDPNPYYHKNEVTLSINSDDQDSSTVSVKSLPKTPHPESKYDHYTATANLTVNEPEFMNPQSKYDDSRRNSSKSLTKSLENHNNLERLHNEYTNNSSQNLFINSQTPKSHKKSVINNQGVDNQAFENDEKVIEIKNGGVIAGNKDEHNMNTLVLSSPNGKVSAEVNTSPTEAVNLELVNLKPMKNGSTKTEMVKNGNGYGTENSVALNSIPMKKETEVDMGDTYEEYFVPVNEHKKHMR